MILAAKFIHLSVTEKKLLLKATGIFFLVSMVVFLFPIRYYSRFLKRPVEDKQHFQNPQVIFLTLGRLKRYLPFKSKCLVEAVTAKILLRKHGFSSTLFLGVAKETNEKLIAHAWLQYEDRIVTGRKGHEMFTVVYKFS